ncbi:MAG: hypothetical protein JXR95_04435 [Deltaproteobacteria bacterium]|nr:hypothetical protein [Deltaproteobacteria bacterium]
MRNALLLFIILSFSSCAGSNSSGTSAGVNAGKKNAPASLYSLEFSENTLTGKITNNSGKELREVVIKVSWTTRCGHQLTDRKFKVVPGGDGKKLVSGAVKSFKYNVKLETSHRRHLIVKGEIVSWK